MRFLSTLSLRRATRSLKRPFGTMHRFLSTLSLRRATICGACCSAIIRNFYPRSPCGERLEMARAQFAISEISIHALLAESDLVVIIFWCSTMQFLSTLSLRRATTAIHVIQGGVDISIHALLAESDPPRHWHGGKPGHFYPRSPCGERQCARGPLRGKAPFLSTLSLRRATILAPLYNPDIVFLSTLSLRRATSSRRASCSSVEFLSTLSLRRATRAFAVYNPPGGISIHALLAESD